MGRSDFGGPRAIPNIGLGPPGDFFEDLRIGTRLDLGAHVFTREEIVDFACNYDPQPFHMDDEAAARSELGRLAASGWHTVAIWMRLYVHHRSRVQAQLESRNAPAARPGPSPGFRDMRWRRPVHPGDTITYTSTIVGKRRLGRRDWGLVLHQSEGVNQHGRQVLEFRGSVLWEKRPASMPFEVDEAADRHLHVA